MQADLFAPVDLFDQVDLFFTDLRPEFLRAEVAQLTTWDWTAAGVDLFAYADFFAQADLFYGALNPAAWRVEFEVETTRGLYTGWQVPRVRGFPLLSPINLTATNLG